MLIICRNISLHIKLIDEEGVNIIFIIPFVDKMNYSKKLE